MYCRIDAYIRLQDDLHATINSKTADAESRDHVLTELQTDLQKVSGAVSSVDLELRTYQVGLCTYK